MNLEDNKELKVFPKGIKFIYPWREYQSRVLAELEEHLKDDHLHIIAPPGSGKTILGLEVSLRLNKPTLIFAPTIAIRNQWIHRFCALFLQTDITPNWISTDINNPKFLTISTYQGLHAACSGLDVNEEEAEEETLEQEINVRTNKNSTNSLIKKLKQQKVGTIVVDEAHHLKNAWWKSLNYLKEELKPTIVGLTATPPYDVTYAEWNRYVSLNGPVDAEISVPELVVEGDLCPHQDFVYFSNPTDKEVNNIFEFRQKVEKLFVALKLDKELIYSIENHPIYVNPLEHLEWIYLNLSYYSASLIYLKSIGRKISKKHLEIIGVEKLELPALNYEWIEILLKFYLFKDEANFIQYEAHQLKLMNKLKRNGVLEKRSINFLHNKKVTASLSASISKLESISKIVNFESSQLQNDLRLVVLTDYIRKEFLTDKPFNNLVLNKIGVMSIFEQLRRSNVASLKLGVLTGSLIIIPVTAIPLFNEEALKYNIDSVSFKPIAYDKNYVIVPSNSKLRHAVVSIVTEVFQKGEIKVLIGTKSLLGEGWDAPKINALVLASFVGSYVLSNQMRGRAIRTQQNNKDKTGNIWHLVCVDPTAKDGGDDVDLLKRRFKSFVGVSHKLRHSIENGINRLELPFQTNIKAKVEEVNIQMFSEAKQRPELKQKWDDSLKNGVKLVEEIRIPFSGKKDYKATKVLYYNRTIQYLFGMLSAGILAYCVEILQSLVTSAKNIKTYDNLFQWMLYIFIMAVFTFGGFAFRTIRLYLKYRDITKDVHQIGEALVKSLIHVKAIKTPLTKLKVISAIDDYGAIYSRLDGGTTYEKSLYISTLLEIIGAVDNPRYVIVRKSFFLKIFSQKDYHSIPDIIGRKKEYALYFNQQWNDLVGSSNLIYTRTIEGRKLLLKSRMQSLAAQFIDKTERINKWK